MNHFINVCFITSLFQVHLLPVITACASLGSSVLSLESTIFISILKSANKKYKTKTVVPSMYIVDLPWIFGRIIENLHLYF